MKVRIKNRKEKSIVPGTLLLEKRAKLSLNYLTGNLNQRFKYLLMKDIYN